MKMKTLRQLKDERLIGQTGAYRQSFEKMFDHINSEFEKKLKELDPPPDLDESELELSRSWFFQGWIAARCETLLGSGK